MTAVTEDTFFNGRLKVRQPRDGYRYSIDAVLLAGFFRCKEGQTVLDLGTGCGILPLTLASRHPGLRLLGVEIPAELAGIAQANVRINGLEERVHILHQDLKSLKGRHLSGRVHQVVCNPPYRRMNSGRVNPHDEKAGARHEIFARLVDLNVTILACPACMQVSGVSEEDLREGVRVAEKEQFFDFTEGRILTLDY